MFFFDLYHQQQKHRENLGPNLVEPDLWPEDWKTVFIKTYERFACQKLPPAAEIKTTLLNTISSRHSHRQLSNILSASELSTLLTYSIGERKEALDKSEGTKRVYPSAGGRYPLEFYILLLEPVGEFDVGLYHYDVVASGLRCLLRRLPAGLEKILTIDNTLYGATCLVFCTAVFSRTSMKYGERGYRFALLEAGATLQNFSLVATALNVGSVALGGVYDDVVEKLLEVDGSDESLIYTIAFG